ncbi:MAG TPA: lipid A deacylase LpxR family protein [Segetibacter sp.]|jgi:hypothetical protein
MHLNRFWNCFFISLFFVSTANSQRLKKQKFDKQITLTEVNDLFALRWTDGYYTNGLAIQFSKLNKSTSEGVKTIFNYEIGQKIFTPGIRELYVITEIDRPITGYLYGKFTVNKYKAKNKFYSYGLSVGTIGSNALGQQVLDLVHPLGGINSNQWDWIWRYQLKNEIGANLHGSFAKSIINYSSLPFIKVIPKTDVTLGTTFSNITQSIILQSGIMNDMANNSYWNSLSRSSDNNDSKHEIFLFYQPQLMYQAYNATVQGGMFRKDKGGITSEVNPFVVLHEFGIMAAIRRYTASFHYTYQTKETKLQENNHRYGKVQVAYRF